VGLSASEIAERSGCPPERIQELEDLGILVRRDEDGPFDAKDIHRVLLMQAFEDAGIDLDVIARGIAAGKLSYENLRLFLPEPAELSQTSEELAVVAGRSPELIRRLVREFGLPQAESETRVRADDVPVLLDVLSVWAHAEDDELARLARVYGQNIRKVVASDIELASSTIFARLRSQGLPDDEMRRTAGEMGSRVMELGKELMLWLRGRHLEHELLAATVQNTEDYVEELGFVPKRSPRPPAIAFLDLTGYTALTEERGDEAGVELADRLATIVHEAAQPHGGNPVKWLGDGVMFHFDDPSAAVLTGLDLVKQIPATIDVRARVGINAGHVILRDGDYFGRTVNVASRIADYARPGEVLLSDEVKERWRGEGVRFDAIGPVVLKGLRDELTLHAASRA
jgi:adenylate cyclase